MQASAEAASELDAFSFDWDTHTYTNAEGMRRPSVTQCLHSAGLYDFSHVKPEVLERKRRIGFSVHRAAAEYDAQGWIDETWLAADEVAYFEAWKAFRKDTPEMEWEFIEVPMLRRVAGIEVGGTPDRIGWYRGKPIVVDLKCATAVHPAWQLQTANYEMMHFQVTRCGAAVRMIVQLRPDRTYRATTHDDPADAAPAIACLQLAAWKRNAGLKESQPCN